MEKKNPRLPILLLPFSEPENMCTSVLESLVVFGKDLPSCAGLKVQTGRLVLQVKTVDENMNNTLVRDSALELEMLELFEDITLEDVVANKACVGKVIGCKDMSTSVVKKILTGVWRRLGPWRMKKCEEGVLGFFFEHEEDCSFVLLKRPWLVNGVLLNIKTLASRRGGSSGRVRCGSVLGSDTWATYTVSHQR
ncbi:hypothetical protein F8388_012828 [Cannabis sativa]|uniref:DUF4283 domain-containing protein n=1 Tax=Cannabis sativa TaxID=3483 RepID=A0A7J6F408_CANSA|nr:hypothetical protein F8388_012828 [Cannabis sativa]